jgi:hypothetical protein
MAIGSGLPGLQQSRAFTEVMPTVDVTAGIEASMQAVGQVAGKLKEILTPMANQEAAARGAQAVTRDENGKLKVETRMIFSEQDAVFMNAAESAYLAQLQLDVADDFRELRANPEIQLDPAKFRAAAEGALSKLMDNTPSEFRGSVQELYNREVARNIDDIANTAERVRVQKQKSALDANLERTENDLFALASQGGLNSEAGREATANYLSSLEQLRNPIWGVSDEEIALMADKTMSVAKGMSAKGAVIAAYQAGGYDAAEKYAEDFFNSTDLQMSPSQREALKNDALQEVRGMETERRSRANEAKAAYAGAQAQNAADLDVAVNDYALGIGGDYTTLKADLDEARRNNRITEAKWASATKRLNNAAAKREKETAKDAAVMDMGFARVESGIGFNPKDSDDRKIGDKVFQTWVDPGADEATVVDQAISFTRHQGMVPTAVRDGARTAMFSGSPDRQVAAANTILRLRDANPNAAGEAFTTAELERAQTLMDSVSNGLEPVDAVKRMDDLARVSPDERARRKEVVGPLFNKGEDRTGKGRGQGLAEADELVVELGGDPKSYDPTKGGGQIVGFIRSDYENAFKAAFERTGNLTAARETARQEVKTRYGATRFGVQDRVVEPGIGVMIPGEIRAPGQPTLQAYAPEVVYGAGMDPDSAHAWQSKQLGEDLGGTGLNPSDYGLTSWDEASKLSLIPAPGAMPNGGLGYSVIGPNGKPVVDANGEALIWQPDPAAMARKSEAEVQAATEAARKARADKLNTSDLPDWH